MNGGLSFMSNPRRDSELDRLNLALSSAEMGTWDWDISADSMWWDKRMHALFGLPPNAFKGCYEDFLNIVHEEDRERIRGEFAKAISTRTAVDTEFQITWPSDQSDHLVRIRSKVHGDPTAKIERIVGVVWDISERRKTELALAKERNLLKTLMYHLPYAIYFKDLDSRFIGVNRNLTHLFGKTDPAELIGKTDHDFFSTEHAEGALADEHEIMRTGVDYEEKHTWPDQEDSWVATTKMPLRDAQGKIIGTFGISHDITEKKRAAEIAAMRVWGKYAPVDLVRRLYREKSEPVLGGELMEISIMFSDIKGFTALSEQLDPNRLAEMLGLYLDALSCIIQRDTHGTIDKYIGDAIMAIWNAPEPVPDHPQMACLAALRCRDTARSLAQTPEWREFPVFETRFGLHCAKALVGHLINLASRLGMKGTFEDCRQVVSTYESAFSAYAAGNFERALAVLEENASDPPSNVLIERCKAFLQVPPPADWLGIYISPSK